MVRHTDSTATREFIDFANLNINLATDTLTPTGAFSVTWAVHSVNPKLGTVAAYYLDADTGKWAPLSFTYVAGTPSGSASRSRRSARTCRSGSSTAELERRHPN